MANVLINIKTKFNNEGIKKATQESKRLANSIKNSFMSIKGLAAGAGFAALVGIGKESIDLFREQARVEAQLEAVLRSTAGAAGITASEVKNLAGELQGVTNFGDEATIAGANLLLTFRDIGSNVFPRATKTMLNMSTAMNQGIKESALQLGKALNDPIKGITALSRVGIQFTDQQKEQIKTLQENNQLFEAQTIILDELEAQFGGSAQAAREADGNIIALGNAVGDLKELVGAELTIGFADFNAQLIEAINGLIKAKGAFDLVRSATEEQTAGIEGGAKTWLEFARAIPIAGNFVKLSQMIGNVVIPTESFTDALVDATEAEKNFTEASSGVEQVVEQVVQVNQKLIDTQQTFARDLITINEEATQETTDIWSDFFDEREQIEEDGAAELEQINKDAAKELLENERDLAKELKRSKEDLAKDLRRAQEDTARSLSKISTKERKDIIKKEASFNKDANRENKRKQIDALADQRLFDFELRNLAADGQGNRIREMLERREIEEQIAREKGAVEQEIQQETHKGEIEEIRETASERRNQLILDSDLEQSRKQEDAEITRQRRIEDAAQEKEDLLLELAEKKQVLADNLKAQLEELQTHRNEKLAENEASRLESIQVLGRELAEMQELTQNELTKITAIAGRSGRDAGLAFATGLGEGAATNSLMQQLITGGSEERAARPRRVGPGGPRGFAEGGSFIVGGSGGADSQAVSFNATPGEQVTVSTPQQQNGGVTVNVNGIGGQDLADFLDSRMSGLIQEFQDNHLIPALSGQ